MKLRMKIAAVSTLAPLLLAGGMATASADVTNGQYVSNKGHQCGAQDYITGSYNVGPVQLKQHSLIYRNCAKSGTRHRKANVIADFDGKCYAIGHGKSRVLKALYVVPRTVYRGADKC